ncbi:MAG: flippase-like domain-containing protein [Planctomycetota bacterium]|nr:flippase-like domain-containing protein [Planctomycetota bacterium]
MDASAPMSDAPPPSDRPDASGTGHPTVRALKAAGRVVNHTLFKLGLAVAIMSALYFTGSIDFRKLKPQSWNWVGASVLLVLPSFFISSLRFKVLLGGLELPCSLGRAVLWTMIGEFWNVATPGTGGDLMKMLYVAQAYGKGRRGVAALCVLLDRIMGLWGLLCFGLLACLLGGETIAADPRLVHVRDILLAICSGSLLVLALLASPWARRSALRQKLMGKLPFPEKFEKIYQGFSSLSQKPGLILATLALSVLNHAVWCVSVLALAQGMGLHFDLSAGMVVIPIALFINVFGFAGGFGFGEFAFENLFVELLSQPAGAGGALAFAFHILALLLRITVAGPFYIFGGRKSGGGELETSERSTVNGER